MALSKKTTQPKTVRARKPVMSASMDDMSSSAKIPEAPVMMDAQRQQRMRMYVILGLVLVALYYFKGLFVVALVNGKPIMRYQVIQELEKQAGKGTTDSLIAKKLVVMEAKKKGIVIADKDVQENISKIEKDLAKSGQKLDELLKAQNVTRKEVEEQTRLQLTLKALLADKIKVTDKEIATALDEQKESKPTGMSDADFKKQIATSLEEQKFSAEAQTYIQNIQKNAQITYWHMY